MMLFLAAGDSFAGPVAFLFPAGPGCFPAVAAVLACFWGKAFGVAGGTAGEGDGGGFACACLGAGDATGGCSNTLVGVGSDGDRGTNILVGVLGGGGGGGTGPWDRGGCTNTLGGVGGGGGARPWGRGRCTNTLGGVGGGGGARLKCTNTFGGVGGGGDARPWVVVPTVLGPAGPTDVVPTALPGRAP